MEPVTAHNPDKERALHTLSAREREALRKRNMSKQQLKEQSAREREILTERPPHWS